MSRLSKALKKVIKPVAAVGLAVAVPALAVTAINAYSKARNTPTADEQAQAVATAGATVPPPKPAPVDPVKPGGMLASLGQKEMLILFGLLGFALVMAVKK